MFLKKHNIWTCFDAVRQCTLYIILNRKTVLYSIPYIHRYFYVHCTLYYTHSTLYVLHNLQCTLHIAHCTLHNVHYTLYTAHFTLYTVHCTLHTAHFTPRTSQFTLYTVHCTLYRQDIQEGQIYNQLFSDILRAQSCSRSRTLRRHT